MDSSLVVSWKVEVADNRFSQLVTLSATLHWVKLNMNFSQMQWRMLDSLDNLWPPIISARVTVKVQSVESNMNLHVLKRFTVA